MGKKRRLHTDNKKGADATDYSAFPDNVKTFYSQGIKNVVPLKGRNDKQREYLSAMDNHNIVIGTGVAGSGKTYLAARKSAQWLRDPGNPIEKIVIARPAEGRGKTLGLMPGDKNEKMAGWVVPVIEALEVDLGKSHTQMLIDRGTIELLPLEMVKGRTFNNTAVIIDEAEDIDVDVIKALVTRHGMDCKTMINGDVFQKDIKKFSGLEYVMMINDMYENSPVVLVEFDSFDHCIRSKEARFMTEAIYELDKKIKSKNKR